MRTTLLLVLLSGSLQAQMFPSAAPSKRDLWVFGVSAFGGVPVGEFRNHEDGGGGVDLMLGYQPFRRQPLVLRASGGFMQYGAVYASGFQRVCDEYSCWTERATYQARQHSLMVFQGGPEFMATDGTWRPFAFALAGVTYFRSSANIPPSNPQGTPERETLFSSNNVSSAYGAGIRRVTTRVGREMGLELSARVLRNAAASYLTEDGVQQQPDGSWLVTPRHGAANVLGLHVGLWIGPRIHWHERQ